MTPFADELIAAINAKVRNALVTCGHELNRITDKWTPIWRGYLRRAKRVEVKDNDVYVVTGDSRTKDYVQVQYYKALRHYGNYETGLLSLTQLYRDGGDGNRVPVRRTGMGERYLYARAYRAALRDGRLTRLEPPMWYDRAARDPVILDTLTDIFVGRL